ncbi:MAG: alpha/beta fold hydrolase [Candidatus Omnitrophica bacterium]|nr:alpha/beta fold hydrolase [Candidatus Omnitrophota bacterium]
MSWAIRIFVDVVLILGVWGLFGSQKILFPPRLKLELVPSDEGMAYENLTLTTADGIPISVWLMHPEHSRGLIVGCHGYGGSKADLFWVTRFICDAGYTLVLFDFRNHGESGGRRSTLGKDEMKDLEAVLAWARTDERTQAKPVGLYGFSMGGAIAIRQAVRGADIRAVVADNTYIHLGKTIKRHHKLMYPFLPAAGLADAAIWMTELRLGMRFRGLDPDLHIKTLKAPIYFIHSRGDRTILEEEVRGLFDKVPEPKKLWIAATQDHMGASAYREEYETSILGFLDEHMGEKG